MTSNAMYGRDGLQRFAIDWVPSQKHRRTIGHRAVQDVTRWAAHLRDEDPHEVWRTLCRWYRNDPQRLVTLAFAALAALPIDKVNVVSMLEWTHHHLPDDPTRTDTHREHTARVVRAVMAVLAELHPDQLARLDPHAAAAAVRTVATRRSARPVPVRPRRTPAARLAQRAS